MSVNVLARVANAGTDANPSNMWRDRLCSAVAGIQQRSLSHEMEGELLSFGMGGAELFYLHSFPQKILREHPCPKRFAPMALFNLHGAISLTQNSKSIELQEGQFVFFDSANRLEIDFHAEFEHLYIRMPASSFTKAGFYKAVLDPGDVGCGFNSVFFDLVYKAWKCADDIQPLEYGPLLNSILSLSLLTSPFRTSSRGVEPCIRMKRAMAYIEDNLAESWLTPERVSDAQGVSRRYLDERFGQLGLRIERWIWERRLVRAHEDLVLSARNRRCTKTIIQIALDSGFSSPSHFSRSFKARFGLPPRELKAQVEREAKVGHTQ